MNSAPLCTKEIQNLGQCAFDLSKFLQRETIILAQFRRPEGTVKFEYRLAAVPNYMHMDGAMIIRIDNHLSPSILLIVGIIA